MATLYARQSQLRATNLFSPLHSPCASTRFFSQQQQRPRFSSRLRHALNNSKVQWYQIPVGLGIGFLGLVQFYKVSTREREKQERDDVQDGVPPKKRAKIRPDGPWQVQVMSTLPLKAISRLWGRFNELTIPYYLRVPGFKLYSWIFGVNLDEVAEPDLRTYPNLASFFYRQLKPGSRPLHPDSNALLSPSDGRVLQYGQIEGGDIEQVKGMTYSIDALLGKNTPTSSIASGWSTPQEAEADKASISPSEDLVKTDEEFARVNGISYTVPSLLSGAAMSQRKGSLKDEAVEPPSPSAVSEVRADLALGEKPWYDLISPDNKTSLYYAVIYLAPGDYHRFHSPANWVVERRRHFAGELYSVSPYLQRTLPGLFTLNERVVLLGRWRYGFFSYVPVGATNVGSIKINFDRELRTNSLTTDTAADRAAEEAAARGEPYTGFAEATYASASPVLGGHALRRGEEMGGFQLGSTVVLVFEAPTGSKTPDDKSGWRWAVEKGQTVRMGQALGFIEEE
ncbi:phosphatidylserine decarboxylase [Colletotrichum phormii]|uniref:Phosphatidylserine decarboxylase proenzyme 1, mitochondrial n=1 Tax=Colletotrichum phormii TaxID=359342 RepID=A0AAJ0EK83_9PEZI|nr:phosphatidylserine decarboxylase [Colletotrichum phormii]KAK1654901.1 phosphatidylserine decarboxylase [Colletotrichum phormii]